MTTCWRVSPMPHALHQRGSARGMGGTGQLLQGRVGMRGWRFVLGPGYAQIPGPQIHSKQLLVWNSPSLTRIASGVQPMGMTQLTWPQRGRVAHSHKDMFWARWDGTTVVVTIQGHQFALALSVEIGLQAKYDPESRCLRGARRDACLDYCRGRVTRGGWRCSLSSGMTEG